MKRNLLSYALTLAYLALAAVSCNRHIGGGGSNPDGEQKLTIELAAKEMRAVWVASVWSLDWPQSIFDEAGQKKLYTDYLDKFVSLNFNTVFMQVRPNADAFYDSPYEPWSKWITGVAGKDPGYDVLGFMLAEAHKRGLEFHVWMNPFRIATRGSESTPFPPLDPRIKPEWVKSLKGIQVYNPALPEVRQRLEDIVKDIITKYDVDGVHLDDYFYPSPSTYTSLDDEEDFKQYGADHATIEDFRRSNVDKLVKGIHDVVTAAKPGVLFSISPMADNAANYKSLYADVTKWCKEGWIDIIIPQVYFTTGTSESSFNGRVAWWNQYAYKAVPMVGYGLYRFGDSSAGAKFQTTGELIDQFKYARSFPKMQGAVMYSAKYLNMNLLGITEVIGKEIFPRPAVIPFIGSKTAPDPTPATNLAIVSGKLTWSTPAGLRTVIYKVEDNKGQVVAITSVDEFALDEKGNYCVTTLNVDNAESKTSEVVSYK